VAAANRGRLARMPAPTFAAANSPGGEAALQRQGEAAGEGGGVGELLALDDAGLVEQEPGEFRELIANPGGADRGGEALDQAVARVQFEDALRRAIELAMLLQQAFEVHIEVALVGDEAYRAVGQPLG